MTKEKILAFLNMDPKQPVDTFSMKLFTWFYFSFGAVIILFSTLFAVAEKIAFSWPCILFAVFFSVSCIIFFVSIRFVKKVVFEWFYHTIVVLFSVLALFYGWIVFSKIDYLEYGYSRFSWLHVSVLFATLVLSGYMIMKFIWVFRLIKEHSVEYAQEVVKGKTHIGVPIVIGVSPFVIVRALRGSFETMGIGMGFAIWALMCIWLFFFLVLLTRICIILKYKVHTWLEFDE